MRVEKSARAEALIAAAHHSEPTLLFRVHGRGWQLLRHFPWWDERHFPRSRHARHATMTSGVKVAQHSKRLNMGLTLTRQAGAHDGRASMASERRRLFCEDGALQFLDPRGVFVQLHLDELVEAAIDGGKAFMHFFA
jgi:hypothetical protein